MTTKHRKVAEQALGRPLKRSEVVHHIDCDATNNDPSNLLICTQAYHMALHKRMLDSGMEGQRAGRVEDGRSVHLLIPAELYGQLTTECDKTGIRVSEFIRRAVDASLKAKVKQVKHG